jgi:hypothetical protein
MMGNTAIAIQAVSGLLQQALAYQMAVQKASSEGRDITDEELVEIRQRAVDENAKLAAMP